MTPPDSGGSVGVFVEALVTRVSGTLILCAIYATGRSHRIRMPTSLHLLHRNRNRNMMVIVKSGFADLHAKILQSMHVLLTK